MIRRFASTWCAAWLGALVCSAGALAQPADGIAVEQLTVPELEQAFWECDYFATTRGITATPASKCAVVTATLKKVKFQGDYDAMLAWWRDNKDPEHAKLRARWGRQSS